MRVLVLFILAVITVLQCNGEGLFDTSDIQQGLKEVLQYKVDELNKIKEEVEGILAVVELEEEKNRGAEKNIALYQSLQDIPQRCLELFAATTSAPCTTADVLINQLKSVLIDITTLVSDGIKVFRTTFDQPEIKCPNTINPFTALRCFLRAFKAAYDNLTSLKTEVLHLKNDTLTLYDEYQKYSKDCGKTPVQAQIQLLSLCKNIHSKN